MKSFNQSDINDLDPLFQQALAECIKAGQATATMLRRRFDIGYPRAARLIDQMERAGYISEQQNLNGRAVYVSKEDYEMLFGEFPKDKEPNEMSDKEIMVNALGLFVEDNVSPTASFLRRKYGIGYPRAAKLIFEMEKLGYISQVDDSMSRDVLLTKEEYDKRFGQKGKNKDVVI